MPHGHWLESDERQKASILQASLHARRRLPKGVWTVKDDDGDTPRPSRAAGQESGPNEGVIATADILEVDEEQLDAVQVRGTRCEALESGAVEGPHGNAARALVVADADHVLRLAAKAMLGAEKHHGLNLASKQARKNGGEFAAYAGRVRKKCDPRRPQPREHRPVIEKAIEARFHAGTVRQYLQPRNFFTT